jgi:hypothetical protein
MAKSLLLSLIRDLFNALCSALATSSRVNLLGEPLNYSYEVEDPLQPLDPCVEGYVIDLLKSLRLSASSP